MSFEEAIRFVEELDDRYYTAFPSFGELCGRYGDPNGTAFYSRRDLFYRYRKLFMKENGLNLYDVTDERFCGSRRY